MAGAVAVATVVAVVAMAVVAVVVVAIARNEGWIFPPAQNNRIRTLSTADNKSRNSQGWCELIAKTMHLG